MSEESIERKIQGKHLNAPRLTPDDIDAVIISAKYHHFENTTLTVCCLVLQNGTTVVGESACVSIENFDAELGKEIAYDDARRKVWALEGYLMKERIHLSDTGEAFPPLNMGDDVKPEPECSIDGDWRELLVEIFEKRRKLLAEEHLKTGDDREHMSLPKNILDDIRRTMELDVASEIIITVGVSRYKVIDVDEHSAIVEAVNEH